MRVGTPPFVWFVWAGSNIALILLAGVSLVISAMHAKNNNATRVAEQNAVTEITAFVCVGVYIVQWPFAFAMLRAVNNLTYLYFSD